MEKEAMSVSLKEIIKSQKPIITRDIITKQIVCKLCHCEITDLNWGICIEENGKNRLICDSCETDLRSINKEMEED